MAQTIKLKRSAVAGRIPTLSSLDLGEVAINTTDGKMYMKKSVSGVESIVEVTSVQLPTDPTFNTITLTGAPGPIEWNSDESTVDVPLNSDVTLQMGQETLFYAKATEAISNGDVVMFAGAQGDHLMVSKADMSLPQFEPEYVIGIATQDFAVNDFGFVTTFGKVRGLNTAQYTEGDVLYLDPNVSGGLTTTRPTPTDHIIQMCAVTRSHITEGTFLVRPTHFHDTDEVPEGADNLYFTDQRVFDAADSRYVNVTGDTMSGNLTFSQDNSHIYFGNQNTFIGEMSNSNRLELRGGGSASAQTLYLDNQGRLGFGTLPSYRLSVHEDLGSGGVLAEFKNSNSTYSQELRLSFNSSKDVTFSGGSSTGGFVFNPGTRGVTVNSSLSVSGAISGALDYNDITNPPSIDNSVDYINAASFDTATGVLTLSGVGRAGATIDLDGRYLQSETDSQTLSWNGSNGELSISNGNTVDLDGRYLQSFSETDTLQSVTTRGNTTTNDISVGSITTQDSITFNSPASDSITATMLDGGTLSFSGTSGQLFSISDSMSGTIFSVNDVSGIPSVEVDDDGTIRLAEFSGNTLVGTDVDNGTDKLQVNGSISASEATFSGKVILGGDGAIAQIANAVAADTSNAYTLAVGSQSSGKSIIAARDINTSGGGYQIGGTTVIDSARNAIGFQDIKGAGSYHEFGNAIGSVANDGSWNARLNVAGTQHAKLDVKSVSDGIITSMYAHTGHGSGRVGTTSNHPLGLVVNGVVHADLKSTGVLNTSSGYEVGGTTVIDSSRNLVNIGNIDLIGRVQVTGGEGREIRTYMPSSYGTNDIVSGHEYGWYNDYWRIGMSRSADSAGEAFRFNYSGSYVAQIGTTGIFDGEGYRVNGTNVIDSNRNADFARLVLSTNNDTIVTGHAAMRRGSSGEAYIDAPGHIILNMDSNNNNTDRFFAVRKDAASTNLFSVNESGLANSINGYQVNGTTVISANTDVTVTNTQPKLRLKESDTTDVNKELLVSGGNFYIRRCLDNNTASSNLFIVEDSGDVFVPSGTLDVTTPSGTNPVFTFRENGAQWHYLYADNNYQTNAIGSSSPNWYWKQNGVSSNIMSLSYTKLNIERGTLVNAGFSSSDSHSFAKDGDIQLRIGDINTVHNPFIRLQGNSGSGPYYGDIQLQASNARMTFNDPGTTSGSIGTNPTHFNGDGSWDFGSTITLNDHYTLEVSSSALTSTTQTAIATFPVASFSTAKIIVQAKDTVTDEIHASELLIIHDGTTAISTEYAMIYSGAAPLATYDVDISGSNVRVLATSASTNNTTYKTTKNLIKV